MTTEQRRALADTIPTTEVIKDAVTYPRDRLGEPLDISPERFEAWLARIKRDAAREALDGLAEQFNNWAEATAEESARIYRDTYYPEGDDQ